MTRHTCARALFCWSFFLIFSICSIVSMTSVRSARADYTVMVDPSDDRGTWEGWGGSLAWWGNGIGSSSYQDTYADLLFTLKPVRFFGVTLPGLGLNIARYNIGGGGRPSDNIGGTVDKRPSSMPWYKDIDGYWTDWYDSNPASASWDFYRDSNQRNMMWAARDRGATFEFFSNAPMWWMTTAKSSAGGALQAWNRRDFARYLASVVAYAHSHWGVRVSSLEPFNEPSAGWWSYPKDQEGCNLTGSVQKEILGALREELDARGLHSVTLAASDENTMTQAQATYSYFSTQRVSVNGKSTAVTSLIGKVNVHAYNGLDPWRDNTARQSLRRAVGSKRLWMSEYGDGEGSGMTLARTITEDLNHLRPTAWVYWQPVEPYSAWGLVNGAYGSASDETSPTRGQPLWVYTKYYVLAQFSRFLRPGYQVVGSSDGNTVVAYSRADSRLVLISVNYGSPQTIRYDLSRLSSVPDSTVQVTVTQTDGSRLLSESTVPLRGKIVTVAVEKNSIQSLVVSGVTL